MRQALQWCKRFVIALLSRLSAVLAGILLAGFVLILFAGALASCLYSSAPLFGNLGAIIVNPNVAVDPVALCVIVLSVLVSGGVVGSAERARWHQQRWAAFASIVLIPLCLLLLLCYLVTWLVGQPPAWIVPLLAFVSILLGRRIGKRLFKSAEAGEPETRPRRALPLRSSLRAVGMVVLFTLLAFGMSRAYEKIARETSFSDLPITRGFVSVISYPIRGPLAIAFAERAITRSEDLATCIDSMRTLDRIGHWQSTPALVAATRRQDPQIRLLAICTIAKPEFSRGPMSDLCYRALLRQAEDKMPRVREAALLGLRQFPTPESTRLFLRNVKDPDPYVRLAAVLSLACVRTETATVELKKVAGGKDALARITALFFSSPSSKVDIKSVMGIDPSLAEWHFLQGRRLDSAGLTSLALTSYRQCLAADPTRSDALFAALADARAIGADATRLRDEAHRINFANLTSTRTLMEAARACEETDPRRAEELLDRRIADQSYDSHLLAARILMSCQRWKEAEEQLVAARQITTAAPGSGARHSDAATASDVDSGRRNLSRDNEIRYRLATVRWNLKRGVR